MERANLHLHWSQDAKREDRSQKWGKKNYYFNNTQLGSQTFNGLVFNFCDVIVAMSCGVMSTHHM